MKCGGDLMLDDVRCSFTPDAPAAHGMAAEHFVRSWVEFLRRRFDRTRTPAAER